MAHPENREDTIEEHNRKYETHFQNLIFVFAPLVEKQAPQTPTLIHLF